MFKARARELNCVCHLLQLDLAGYTENKGEWLVAAGSTVGDWLKGLSRPVGLFTFNDSRAARMCVYCQQVGLRVPEDVAILGAGNDIYCCASSPVHISSVDPLQGKVVRDAVKMLDGLMKGESPSETVVKLQCRTVIERRSSDILAVDNPIVSQALRILWDNLAGDIGAEDLVGELKVSRSTLERGFRSCLGRGVNAELRRKRLELACSLLVTTKSKIAEVARKSGFKTTSYFHRAFTKVYAMSPVEFRNKSLKQGVRSAR